MAAAAPSLMGEHMAMVSGQEMTLPAMISSTLIGFWNCASGFMVEWPWFLDETLAICCQVVPYFFMCSRALMA